MQKALRFVDANRAWVIGSENYIQNRKDLTDPSTAVVERYCEVLAL